jgi:hypothetical protein
LGGPEHFARADATNKIGFEMGDVIWDFVAVYPAGSDHPSFSGAPVVAVVDDVRRELAITSPPR